MHAEFLVLDTSRNRHIMMGFFVVFACVHSSSSPAYNSARLSSVAAISINNRTAAFTPR